MATPKKAVKAKVPATPKPRAVKVKAPEAAIRLQVLVNGLEYNASGDTLAQALQTLPEIKAKTKATLTVSRNGTKVKELILTIPSFNRLFYPGMTGMINRTVLSKRFDFFING